MRPIPGHWNRQARRVVNPHPFWAGLDFSYDALDSGIVTRNGFVDTWPEPYGGLTVTQGTAGKRPVHADPDTAFGATTGESVQWDGVDDLLVSAGSVPSRMACTYGLVFRTGPIGAARELFTIGTFPLAGGCAARVTASGNLLFVSWNGPTNAQSGKFFGVAANTVYRVIAVWVPTVGTYAWTLYSSNVATGTDNGSTVPSATAQTGIVRLGGQDDTPTNPFNGRWRRFERINYALSVGEVATYDAYLAGLLV